MNRCPKCKRFGVIYDQNLDVERCIWTVCLWINEEGINLEEFDYGVNFQRFRDAITKKSSLSHV